ncbi:MAG: DUF5682 family protein [Blastocatellia bacterium]
MGESTPVTVRLFGIRHHGPLSARHLRSALDDFAPDLLLVEGPADAASILDQAFHPEMRPPVAILVHAEADPQTHAFFPLADFSPEWQALRYAAAQARPLRLIDLPLAHQFPLIDGRSISADLAPEPLDRVPRPDPEWWEQLLEEGFSGSREAADPFQSLQVLMRHVRREFDGGGDPLDPHREAWMRQSLRQAERALATDRPVGAPPARLALICGAWHLPALELDAPGIPTESEDAAQLNHLPTVATRSLWVPWSDRRLGSDSRDGAWIKDPGWARHLWETGANASPAWVGRVNSALRAHSPTSTAAAAASVEVVRLAETLAALRDQPRPGRAEVNDALLAVRGPGEQVELTALLERLMQGDREGSVPDDPAGSPLARELVVQCREHRLPVTATPTQLTLDLREPADRARSQLLHRAALLGTGWCQLLQSTEVGRRLGLFEECWRLTWSPAVDLALVRAGQWGPTLLQATTACWRRLIDKTNQLPELVALTPQVLATALPEAITPLLERLDQLMVSTHQIERLLAAFPPLVHWQRYGDVRGIPPTMLRGLGGLIDALGTRICLFLPEKSSTVSSDLAELLSLRLHEVNRAMLRLDPSSGLQERWWQALRQVLDQRHADPRLAGRSFGLLLTARRLALPEAERGFALALSRPGDLGPIAAWLDGLLVDSGEALDYQEEAVSLLDRWLQKVDDSTFRRLLPVLRRTFSQFPWPLRQRLAGALTSPTRSTDPAAPVDMPTDSAKNSAEQAMLIDSAARGALVLPWLQRLLAPDGGES